MNLAIMGAVILPADAQVPPMLDEVTVVIPAFNEEAAIPLVLRNLPGSAG